MVLGPFDGVGIGPLAGEVQGLEAGHVVGRAERAAGVFLLDRAERGGRGEQRLDAVLGDHPPVDAGVGRADRLALEQDAGRSVQQRGVDDVGVPHHPADVGGGPEHLARPCVVDVGHRPFEDDRVPAIVADDPLGLARRPRGVEDVERIGRRHRHAVDRRRRRDGLVPVDVAAGDQLRGSGLALEDDAEIRFVAGDLDRLVEQRLVMDHPAGLDPAGAGDDRLGRRIVDPDGELVGREPAEDDRVDRADPWRRRAWRPPPRAPSACRSPPGRRGPRPAPRARRRIAPRGRGARHR